MCCVKVYVRWALRKDSPGTWYYILVYIFKERRDFYALREFAMWCDTCVFLQFIIFFLEILFYFTFKSIHSLLIRNQFKHNLLFFKYSNFINWFQFNIYNLIKWFDAISAYIKWNFAINCAPAWMCLAMWWVFNFI